MRLVHVRGKDRGILAGRRFAAGDVVDTTPVLVIPARQWLQVKDTVLGAFGFAWDDATGSVAVALGLTSLLNHSYAPNLVFERKLRSRLIEFVALRHIEAGEELTLNYNGDPDDREPVWFDVN